MFELEADEAYDAEVRYCFLTTINHKQAYFYCRELEFAEYLADKLGEGVIYHAEYDYDDADDYVWAEVEKK